MAIRRRIAVPARGRLQPAPLLRTPPPDQSSQPRVSAHKRGQRHNADRLASSYVLVGEAHASLATFLVPLLTDFFLNVFPNSVPATCERIDG